ncbi:MAG TPA: hypothetical protein PLD92_04835, partial [Candidatus Omnitrophota bacterium]|nr:hypothetical protein [Candidatus Omnitrophota bacterium]
MLKTTLNNLDNSMFEFPGFWHPEREKLLAALKKTRADDEPVPYSFIVETCGLPAAVYCCRAATKYYHVWREFACWCALSVK